MVDGREYVASTTYLVVGVTKQIEHLHLFGNVERPDNSFVLGSNEKWNMLLHAKVGEKLKITSVSCGNHGAEQETVDEIVIDEASIHSTRVEHNYDEKN